MRDYRRSALLVLAVVLAGCGGGGGGEQGGQQGPELFTRSAMVANAEAISPKQRCLEDCWAACAESVARSYGAQAVYLQGWIPAIQEWFALKMFGADDFGIICQGAPDLVIAASLTGAYFNLDQQLGFALEGHYERMPVSDATAERLVKLVKENHTFIIGVRSAQTSGHAMVVAGLEWKEDASGKVVDVTKAFLLDPWPYDVYGMGPPLPTTVDATTDIEVRGVVWAEQVQPTSAPPPAPARGGKLRSVPKTLEVVSAKLISR